MTISQKKKILKKIQALESDIEKLEGVRIELALSGYASATMSSGGGSRSYTRMDIDKVTNTISILKKELNNLNRLLSGVSQKSPTSISIFYS